MFGTINLLFFLYLVSEPSPPELKSLTPINSTSVQLVWMKENSSDMVDGVTIEYMYEGPCDRSKYLSQSSTNVEGEFDDTITISDLQEYSEYSFKIRAENLAGTSYSNEMRVTTLSASRFNKRCDTT